jgi:hypothetical protein
MQDSFRPLGHWEFLKGINVHAAEARAFTVELIEFLKKTPIEWVRIHPLPSRRLKLRGISGLSYIDAIEKFAQAGFNLILPIDVGVKENVGVITGAHLRKFVDDSYGESYKAVKQIETRLARHNGIRVIYGIENEIDTKEWILQSLPTVGWRETALSWIELSVNKDLKYKRLGHILEGIREAAPGRPTMVNFEADDPIEDWTATIAFMLAGQAVFSKLGLLEKDARSRMNNYRIDVGMALSRLRHFDIIGLDNYPNYFTKVPPRGGEIGAKVTAIAKRTHKPVINVEFGYTTTGRGAKRIRVFEAGTPSGSPPAVNRNDPIYFSPEENQKKFFENALSSIESSASQGTFPWALMIDPGARERPAEEIGFSLLKIGSNRMLEPVPALDYYISWLDIMKSREERAYSVATEQSPEGLAAENLRLGKMEN